MRSIESGALALLDRILGLGAGGEQFAMLDDGHVSQVLDVAPVARRSLPPQGGLFWGLLRNVHGAGATAETSTVNPYTTAHVYSGWPSPVPEGFDVWLAGTTLEFLGTYGNFTRAALDMTVHAPRQGFGVDQAGAAATPAAGVIRMGLCRWDETSVFDGIYIGLQESGDMWMPLGIRIPRGTELDFRSHATNAVTMDCGLLLGLFPAGLGQDIAP